MVTTTEQWCFVYKGHRYVFNSYKQAQVVAFKMTGKIGSVPIYKKVIDVPKERKQRDKITLVRLILVCLALAIAGLVWDAGWTVMTFVSGILMMYEALVEAWPLVALAFIAWLALVLVEWRYEVKLEKELPLPPEPPKEVA